MLISNICFINSIVKKHNLKKLKILHSGKKNEYMRKHITEFLKKIHQYPILIEEMTKRYPEYFTVSHSLDLGNQIINIEEKWKSVNDNMDGIRKILDSSISYFYY